jgi:hypothetical protein
MTLFAWYGPWAWPAWPAFTMIDLLFGHSGFADYPFATKSVIVCFLIVVNVTFWGVLAWCVVRVTTISRPDGSVSASGRRR